MKVLVRQLTRSQQSCAENLGVNIRTSLMADGMPLGPYRLVPRTNIANT